MSLIDVINRCEYYTTTAVTTVITFMHTHHTYIHAT